MRWNSVWCAICVVCNRCGGDFAGVGYGTGGVGSDSIAPRIPPGASSIRHVTSFSTLKVKKTIFLNSSFYRFLALGTIAMLKMGQFGVECDNRRRNWWDPVEMWNLAVIPRFGHSLVLLAAIPGQPNAYGALAFFRKMDRGWNIFDLLSKSWFLGSWILDFWFKFWFLGDGFLIFG